MAFSFTERIATGKNGTKSINGLIDSLVSAIAAALTNGVIATAQLADLAVTTAKLAAGAVTTAKIGGAAVTAAKINADAFAGIHYVSGVDATSAPVNIVIASALATDRVVCFRNFTDRTDLSNDLLTPYDGGVTLAAGNNLSSKGLLVILLPASA